MAQVNPPAPPLLLTGEESPRHIPETDEDQNLLFKLMTSATSGSLFRDPVAMYRWIFNEFLKLMERLCDARRTRRVQPAICHAWKNLPAMKLPRASLANLTIPL